jgi:hypothetical protein
MMPFSTREPLGECMRTRAAITLTAACLAVVTACGSTATTAGGPERYTSAPADEPEDHSEEDYTGPILIPDMTGKQLSLAVFEATTLNFGSSAHDALGHGRVPDVSGDDRRWKVCSQTPKAGSYTSGNFAFAVVKLDEVCPVADADEGQATGSTMPGVEGKAVTAARRALGNRADITVTDASGLDRILLRESEWRTCTQQPAAGIKLDGQHVKLTAVKVEESC